jgi:hypothetical protein
MQILSADGVSIGARCWGHWHDRLRGACLAPVSQDDVICGFTPPPLWVERQSLLSGWVSGTPKEKHVSIVAMSRNLPKQA